MRRAKKRIVGWPMPTHTAVVVPREPAGSASAWLPLPLTFQGSLPAQSSSAAPARSSTPPVSVVLAEAARHEPDRQLTVSPPVPAEVATT